MADLPPPPPGRSGWPWEPEGARVPGTMADGSPWPPISVVTPSYNQGLFIEETIRSILLQGYPNLEYIIMDGGSTDGSLGVIRSYEPWLAHWQSKPDGGQAQAINTGWRSATGAAITWLNSDDLLTPGSLFLSVQSLFSSEDTDLVYGNNIIINQHSRELYRLAGRTYDHKSLIIKAENPIQQPGFLMRRSLLQRVGFLDESLLFAMDFDYWVRASLHGLRIKHIPEPLAMFREHPAAKTSTAHVTHICDRYRIFKKTFCDDGTPPDRKQQRKCAAAHVESNAAYIAYKASDYRRAIQHAQQHLKLAGLQPSLLTLGVLGVSSLRSLRVCRPGPVHTSRQGFPPQGRCR